MSINMKRNVLRPVAVAGAWKRFVNVAIPGIAPMMLFNVVSRTAVHLLLEVLYRRHQDQRYEGLTFPFTKFSIQ